MSTVLEKAVLLDETGQLIVDKLDDIKEAIGNSGEYIPLAIRVTTPPTKVSYYEGDALDLSGIVVSLVGSNGSLIDVTSACTFSPADGATLSTSDTSVAITYHYGKDNVDFTTSQDITVTGVAAVSIAVTTPPTITQYIVGDTLDLTGIVIIATYNNGTTSDVTASCTFSPANGSTLSSDAVDTVNISYTSGGITLTTSQSITVSNPIYGVEWDGTATTTWTRTDMATDFTDPVPQMSDGNGGWTQGSSPFDTVKPWSDIERINDADAGVLVKIPKFYYKWTRDGAKMKLQISAAPVEGFFVSPAHADREDGEGERDFVYVGAYHCAITTYKSTSGVKPANGYNDNRAVFRTKIHQIASDVWQWDYAMYWTICMLYLVEYADWDSQRKIGYGCGTNTSATDNSGLTDGMTYHTGTSADSISTYGHVRYRYIEDLWANVKDIVDGIYFTSSNVYCIKNPAQFSDSENGTLVGTRTLGDGTIKAWSNPTKIGFEYALVPNDKDTNYPTNSYITDLTSGSIYGTYLIVGGSFNSQNLFPGLFSCNGNTSGSSSTAVGSRLMKLPDVS